MDRIIQLLPPNSFQTVLKQTEEGLRAASFIASLRWGDGKSRRFYLKSYPKELHRGLINEITGYLLAHACGLPQPQKVALIPVAKNVFPPEYQALLPIYNGFIWCWATEDAGSTPNLLVNMKNLSNIFKFFEFFSRWNKWPDMLAFDEWVANQDRNTGNVVIKNGRQISLIDHGAVPISENWQIDDLDAAKQFANKFLSVAYQGKNPPLNVSSAMCKAAVKHTQNFQSVMDELEFWWKEFLSPVEYEPLKVFFELRASNEPMAMKQRVGLVL